MQQNYIQQLNRFHLWLETNYLPPCAQLLWFKMIGLFNRSGWAEWVQVDTRRLILMSGVATPKSAYRMRDALVSAGLLEYRKGKKGCPTRYRMLYFPCPQNTESDTKNDTKNDTENGTSAKQQTAHTNKPKEKENKTVVKEIQAKEKPMPEHLDEAWRKYCAMRAEKGEPVTEEEAPALLRKLHAMAPDSPLRQRLILNLSSMYGVAELRQPRDVLFGEEYRA